MSYARQPVAEEDEEPVHGHVTSLSVLRTHRKFGLATKLLSASHERMVESFDAKHCELHVRKSNGAALHLYKDTLGYDLMATENAYYADGEDAYAMRKTFPGQGGADAPPPPGEIARAPDVVEGVD